MRSEMKAENRVSGVGHVLLILLIGIVFTGLFNYTDQMANANALLKNPITITKPLPFGKALIKFDHSSLHLMVSNKGNSIEISSQNTADQNHRMPPITWNKFNHGDISILSGELTIKHRNIRWAIVMNKNN